MNNRRGMRGGKVWLFLSLSVLAAPASRVDAQPIVDDIDSIELMAADSTLVVRGTILAMRTEEKPQGYVWHTLAFGVDETLKGEHRPRREFVVLTNTVEKDLERWRERKRPLLVFLDESRCTVTRWGRREYLRFPFAPRTGYPKGSFLELDPGARSRAYTMDLQPATDPELILRATKTAIAAPGSAARLCVHQAMPPNVGLVRVSVPMDGRLEEQARKWLASDDKALRREGVRALAYFRSEANAAMLRRLLNDPATSVYTREERGRLLPEELVYEVREEAASVLEAWGEAVPRVILREPRDPGRVP